MPQYATYAVRELTIRSTKIEGNTSKYSRYIRVNKHRSTVDIFSSKTKTTGESSEEVGGDQRQKQTLHFDVVHDFSAKQVDLFDSVGAPLVDSFVDGQSCLLVVVGSNYRQRMVTLHGIVIDKLTIACVGQRLGLVPRFIREVLRRTEIKPPCDLLISCVECFETKNGIASVDGWDLLSGKSIKNIDAPDVSFCRVNSLAAALVIFCVFQLIIMLYLFRNRREPINIYSSFLNRPFWNKCSAIPTALYLQKCVLFA